MKNIFKLNFLPANLGSIIALVTTLAFSGCSPSSDFQKNTDKQAGLIAGELDRFQQALQSRDTLLLKDIYAENAVSLLQNQPVRTGRNAIIKRWKKSMALPVSFQIVSQCVNVSSGGQDAFQYGSFEIHSSDTTNVLLASGKIMFLWKRVADNWEIALEMDNFDAIKPQ